jgi:hypothetical protein
MSKRVSPVLVVLVVLVAPGLMAQSDADTDEQLDGIRNDLAELRFEKALVEIETLLASPRLTESDRVETLILRAQAHAAYGDLDAVETDYREILKRRPAYVPEATLTPPKAMTRFNKVRSVLVGSVQLAVTPPDDVEVSVDGRKVVPAADGLVRVLAGDRVVRVERGGFDPVETSVAIKAGESTRLEVRLIPNARTVVVRTEPDGVAIKLDGVPVGTTARPWETAGEPPAAELVVENVSLGDHTFELSKPCFRTVLLEDFVTVDIDDYSARVFKPVTLERVHSQLAITGGPKGAEVRVDGVTFGDLPLEPLDLCPGFRKLEIRDGGRIIWASEEKLPVDRGMTTVTIDPRPNLALVGTDEWPEDLDELRRGVSTIARVSAPATMDLTRSENWETLDLPDATDLALAVMPRDEAEGSSERWLLYSQMLRTVERIDGEDLAAERPQWIVGSIRVNLVDSRIGGAARIAEVAEGGPASRAGLVPGDRVHAIDGKPVDDAASALRTIRALGPGAEIEVAVESARGDRSMVKLKTVASPQLFPDPYREGPRGLMMAAWASVDGVAGDEATRSTAVANMALLLFDAGRNKTALEMWRRVRWGERSGVGKGTTAYYVGRNLEALGREAGALEAYREAAGSAASTFHDDGPAVAPAATDHLADLGVSQN